MDASHLQLIHVMLILCSIALLNCSWCEYFSSHHILHHCPDIFWASDGDPACTHHAGLYHRGCDSQAKFTWCVKPLLCTQLFIKLFYERFMKVVLYDGIPYIIKVLGRW